MSLWRLVHGINTVMCCLTTGIRSEKCVVKVISSCEVIECSYTNLDSTV